MTSMIENVEKVGREHIADLAQALKQIPRRAQSGSRKDLDRLCGIYCIASNQSEFIYWYPTLLTWCDWPDLNFQSSANLQVSMHSEWKKEFHGKFGLRIVTDGKEVG